MKILNTKKRSKNSKERGASLVEYGLLIALIAVIGIPAVQILGKNISMKTNDLAEKIGAQGTLCDASNPAWPDC